MAVLLHDRIDGVSDRRNGFDIEFHAARGKTGGAQVGGERLRFIAVAPGNDDIRTAFGQTTCDGGANPAVAAGEKDDFAR